MFTSLSSSEEPCSVTFSLVETDSMSFCCLASFFIFLK